MQGGGAVDEIGYPFSNGFPATLLVKASFFENIRAVEILTRFGADSNYVHTSMGSPLIFAATSGNLDLCNLLISRGAAVNSPRTATLVPGFSPSFSIQETPLYRASKNGHHKVIKLLISHGVDINIIVDSMPIIGDVITPLSIAARQGHLMAVEALLNGGADVNFMYPIGFSALHEAIVKSDLEIFNLLIDNGADIHQRGSIYGATPLWLARNVGRGKKSIENKEIQDYLNQNDAVANLYLWAEILMLSGLLAFR